VDGEKEIDDDRIGASKQDAGLLNRGVKGAKTPEY
jgi:hypothetical protein